MLAQIHNSKFLLLKLFKYMSLLKHWHWNSICQLSRKLIARSFNLCFTKNLCTTYKYIRSYQSILGFKQRSFYWGGHLFVVLKDSFLAGHILEVETLSSQLLAISLWHFSLADFISESQYLGRRFSASCCYRWWPERYHKSINVQLFRVILTPGWCRLCLGLTRDFTNESNAGWLLLILDT